VKAVTVRLAFEDDANVQHVLASALDHLPPLRGALIAGGDSQPILTSARSVAEGREIAELLAAGDGAVE
jgi:hypothetical protein